MNSWLDIIDALYEGSWNRELQRFRSPYAFRGEKASDTFTVQMLEAIGDLRAFDTLSREPFVVFLEPPALDERNRHQLALFSLVSDPTASPMRCRH